MHGLTPDLPMKRLAVAGWWCGVAGVALALAMTACVRRDPFVRYDVDFSADPPLDYIYPPWAEYEATNRTIHPDTQYLRFYRKDLFGWCQKNCTVVEEAFRGIEQHRRTILAGPPPCEVWVSTGKEIRIYGPLAVTLITPATEVAWTNFTFAVILSNTASTIFPFVPYDHGTQASLCVRWRLTPIEGGQSLSHTRDPFASTDDLPSEYPELPLSSYSIWPHECISSVIRPCVIANIRRSGTYLLDVRWQGALVPIVDSEMVDVFFTNQIVKLSVDAGPKPK